MKPACLPILLVAGLSCPLAVGQRPNVKTVSDPTETTVCKVFDNPSSYNNTLVKVRGYVKASFEMSVLMDEHCNEKAIWFAFGDGSVPPQVAVYLSGHGRAGSVDSKGRTIPPLPVSLLKDESFVELKHYLGLSAKGEACADGPPTESIPDCTTYRVTATFSGRIDGVSRSLHPAHMKRSNVETPAGKGFGHMGMFDAQIVVRSVENVVAVDEEKLRDTIAQPEKSRRN